MSVLRSARQSLPPVLAIPVGLDRPHDPDDRHGDAGHGHGHVVQDRGHGPHDHRRTQHKWRAGQEDERGDLSGTGRFLVREQDHLPGRRGSRAGGDGLGHFTSDLRHPGPDDDGRPFRGGSHFDRRRAPLVDQADRWRGVPIEDHEAEGCFAA